MATVYLARDVKHDREVALKILRPEFAAALGAERFLQEIRISAKLDHPHILTLIDSGESEGFVWYVLPYVRGESLREKLTREQQLSIEETVRIATQVASALDYAHGHGVIHRDIKPENILLHEGEAVVADFGIALAVREAGGERLTESGLSLGTPQYMSPEQATGGRALDARSDVYSLGAVVYEMLAGEPPHTGPTVQAVIAKLLAERPTRIRTVRDTVPEGIDTAVMKALSKAPADRFGAAGAFAAALAVSRPAAPPPVERRRRTMVPAAIVGLVLIGAATGALLYARGRRRALDPTRVAVAVFANRTGNPALDPIGLTAADYINRGLVQTGLVEVVDVGVLYVQGLAATGEPTEPRALARRNGAGIVIAGSYDQSGDSLVFQAAIIDVGSGRVLQMLEPVRGPLARRAQGLEALRQRVTVGLAGLIDPRLSAIATPSPEPPTFAAYQAFVAGQGAFFRWSVGDALADFRRAARLDSTFLTAAVWVAWAASNGAPTGCSVVDSVGRALAPHRDQLTLIDRLLLAATLAACRGDNEAASRIIEQQDPTLSHSPPHFQAVVALFARLAGRPREAVEILRKLDADRDLGWLPDTGKVLYRRDLALSYHALGDYRSELRVARDLVRRDPNRLASINLENHALAALGRTEEVFDRLERAVRLPPDPLLLYSLASLTPGRALQVNTAGRVCYEVALELWAHGHAEAARSAAGRAVAWYHAQPLPDQDQPEYRYTLARSLELVGRYKEAQAVVERLATEDPGNVDYEGVRGVVAARQGNRAEAQRIDQALARLSRPYLFGVPTYYRAQIAAVLGDRDRAVNLLREAIAQGAVTGWDHRHSESAFVFLHGYPPFDDVLRPKG